MSEDFPEGFMVSVAATSQEPTMRTMARMWLDTRAALAATKDEVARLRQELDAAPLLYAKEVEALAAETRKARDRMIAAEEQRDEARAGQGGWLLEAARKRALEQDHMIALREQQLHEAKAERDAVVRDLDLARVDVELARAQEERAVDLMAASHATAVRCAADASRAEGALAAADAMRQAMVIKHDWPQTRAAADAYDAARAEVRARAAARSEAAEARAARLVVFRFNGGSGGCSLGGDGGTFCASLDHEQGVHLRSAIAAEIDAHADALLEQAAHAVDVWYRDRWPGAGASDAVATIRALKSSAAKKAAPGRGGQIAWGWATSDEAESWQGAFETREAAIAEAVAHAEPEEAIFVLRGRYPKPSEYVGSAGWICGGMEDAVADVVGGWDDEVFEVRDDTAAQEALKAWADAYVAVLAWGADGDGKPELVRASSREDAP